MINTALDQLSRDEVRALALLLAGDAPIESGRRAFVVAIVAEEDGGCTMTSAPSAPGPLVSCSSAQVRGFAAGLERAARQLRAQLPEESPHD